MNTTVKKTWISVGADGKNRYSVRTFAGIAGIVALAVLIVVGGSWIPFYVNVDKAAFSLALCLGTTALATWLALRLRWRSAHDATAFFLTEDNRLYALDARGMFNRGSSAISLAQDAVETQSFMDGLAKTSTLPDGAIEIVKVDRMKENRLYYAVRCQVRPSNSLAITEHTCFLPKGYEDEQALVDQFKRLEGQAGPAKELGGRMAGPIAASVAALAILIVLCVLSHPAFGLLPQAIYFPCLGAAFVAFFFVVYYVTRHKRGE